VKRLATLPRFTRCATGSILGFSKKHGIFPAASGHHGANFETVWNPCKDGEKQQMTQETYFSSGKQQNQALKQLQTPPRRFDERDRHRLDFAKHHHSNDAQQALKKKTVLMTATHFSD